MNELTAQENIRMLSAIIRKDEQTAATLLDISVAIIFDVNDKSANQLADLINQLLSRTLKRVVNNPAVSSQCGVSVVIRQTIVNDSNKTVYVDVTPDYLMITDKSLKAVSSVDIHPILLLLSAGYIAAQTVKAVVGEILPIPYLNQLKIEFSDIIGNDFYPTDSFNIETTYLAGAGAIGNGFMLALSLLNPSGELHVADPDIVDDGNLNRCVWFSEDDVKLNKAEQLVKLAQPKFENLRLIAHPTTLQSVPAKTGEAWLKRLVIGVDSRRVRRILQNEIPREVYDASTTDIREFVLHFNRQPLKGLACLSCIYSQDVAESAHEQHVAEALGVSLQDVQSNFISASAAKKICQRYPELTTENIQGLAFDSLFKQLCGEGALQTPEDKQVLAPFSFVSVLAGTYLAIEFAKRIKNQNPVKEFNYWKISPWHKPIIRAKKIHHSKTECEFCGNPILINVANSLWS